VFTPRLPAAALLRSLAVLVGCELAGNLLAGALGLPVSGTVLAMAGLFVWLIAVRRVPESLERTSQGLLRILPLLFVPAGVGVVAYLPLLRREWLVLAAAIGGSLAITMLVTWATMLGLTRLLSRRGSREACDS